MLLSGRCVMSGREQEEEIDGKQKPSQALCNADIANKRNVCATQVRLERSLPLSGNQGSLSMLSKEVSPR